MRTILLLTLLSVSLACTPKNKAIEESQPDLTTHFEKHPNQTVTYEQGIAYWELLDRTFPEINLLTYGESDVGKPMHWAILSNENHNTLESLATSKKPLLFINNAIHPGEPCGVDATMMLFRDLLTADQASALLNEINIIALPFYNIGGVLNRNSTTRTNQNGPESYGFRGNAKNLDLNRDFIKADSKNAKAFTNVFSMLQPEVFIDNHTTNGADYQYVMTLISSMPEHYAEPLRGIYEDELLPHLYKTMEANGEPMIPYVNSVGATPFEGIAQFNDLPRYSMGYASLFNTLAFTAEAHMLKSYEQRVWATYELMQIVTAWLADNGERVQQAKEAAEQTEKLQNQYTVAWTIDTTAFQTIPFLGYQNLYKKSEVSGEDRLYYDQSQPVNRNIRFYNQYAPTLRVNKPTAYYISQAYPAVIERLKNNNVQVEELRQDKELEVRTYRIVSFDSRNAPYENHFLHSNVQVEDIWITKQFYAGDYRIPLDQPNQKLLLEMLEPQAADSFFAWNFFDGVLQQKEYFSPYVFEDEAAELLKANPEWKAALDKKKANDPAFAKNTWAQLYFIYQKSEHYEPTHNIYPVYRGQ